MTLKELLLASVSLQFGLSVALLVLVGRLRERVTRIEEWERLREAANHKDKDGRS